MEAAFPSPGRESELAALRASNKALKAALARGEGDLAVRLNEMNAGLKLGQAQLKQAQDKAADAEAALQGARARASVAEETAARATEEARQRSAQLAAVAAQAESAISVRGQSFSVFFHLFG